MLKPDEFKEGHTYVQWIFGLLANLAIFGFGAECGWISPVALILRSGNSPTGYPLSDNMVTLIATCPSLVAIFCVTVYSHLADTFGRKICIILFTMLQTTSWIIRLTYHTYTAILLGRIISGIAAGGCFSVIPIYVKEISQDNIRGILGTLPSIMQTFGIFFAYLLGVYLDYFNLMKVMICIPIVSTFLFLRAPESPEFLVKQGKYEEAIRTVALLRGLDKHDKIVHSVVETMKNEDNHYKSLPTFTISRILKEKIWYRAFILALLMFIFNGVNGVVAILNFALIILKPFKSDINSEILSLSLPFAVLSGSFLLTVIVERFGRKIILFGSLMISALSMTTMAFLMILIQYGYYVPTWIPLLVLVIVCTMYGAGVAPMPYIIMTEIFSFQVRAKLMGIVVTISWSLATIQISSYTTMVNMMGQCAPFILYAILNFAGAIYAIIFLPETRAKSEEEILQLLMNERNIIVTNNEDSIIVTKCT